MQDVNPNSDAPRDPPPEPLTTELRLSGSNRLPLLPWIVLGLIAAALGIMFSTGRLGWSPDPNSQEQRGRALQELTAKNADFMDFADRTRRQGEWATFRSEVAGLLELHRRLAGTIAAVNQIISTLPTSEDGKRMASDPELVRQFVYLRDRDRITTDELNAIKIGLDGMLATCDRALAEKAVLIGVDDASHSRLREYESQMHRQQGSALLTGLRRLIQAAQALAPAEHTLIQAIEIAEQERSERQLAELTKAQNEQRAREEQERLAAERKIEEARRDAEEREQARLRTIEERKLAAERAQRELEAKFEQALPEIRSLLAPMISTGRMHISASGGVITWYAGEPGPLSLTAMDRFGALRPNNEALLGTLFCAGGPSFSNDRPFGSFPERVSYNNGKLRRAQELLVQFGKLMVDRKMLQP